MSPSLGLAVLDRPEQHAVAGGHHVPLIGGQRLQQPPGGALVERRRLVLRRCWSARARGAPGRGGRRSRRRPDERRSPALVAGPSWSPQTVRRRASSPLPLTRSLCGGASSSKPCSSNCRVQSVGRARTLRFLRNSARIFFFLPFAAQPSSTGRFARGQPRAGRAAIVHSGLCGNEAVRLVVGNVVATDSPGSRPSPAELPLLQPRPLQQRLAEDVGLRSRPAAAARPRPSPPASTAPRTCAWRPTGCRPDRAACPSPAPR